MTDQPDWRGGDMPDLSGMVAVVTGANAGLGFEVVKAFAARSAHVVLACRNVEKATQAAARLRTGIATAPIEVKELDLASLESVRTFATSFAATYDRLDLLINNAGVMMVPRGTTEDGFETQLGVNHLGHFALTGLLLPRLRAAAHARVVNVSSLAHRSASIDLDNLMFEHGGYEPFVAYRRSKLANLLFAYELQRRLAAGRSPVQSLAAHPGVSATELGDHLFERRPWFRPLKPLMRLALQSARAGAEPILRAATDPAATGGEYYGPANLGEQRGPAIRVESSAASHDLELAYRLWDRSEQLTGIAYP